MDDTGLEIPNQNPAASFVVLFAVNSVQFASFSEEFYYLLPFFTTQPPAIKAKNKAKPRFTRHTFIFRTIYPKLFVI